MTKTNLKIQSLKNGTIGSSVSIVIFLTIWHTAPNLMHSFIYSALIFIVGSGIILCFCYDLRLKAGGYWTFSEALWHIFIMSFISMAIFLLFTIVYSKYVDPSYPRISKELAMAKSEKIYNKIGFSENQKNELRIKAEDIFNEKFYPSFSQVLTKLAINSIYCFIGSLICAAIFKKEKPQIIENF